MFSSKEDLNRKTPKDGVDRESFLSLLVDEFIHTKSYAAKCEVLANLANFAYDPINYGFIRNVGVLDIFLYVLKQDTDPKLQKFAITGLCNLVCDPENVQYVLGHAGIDPIVKLLYNDQVQTVTNAITTLYYIQSECTNKLNIDNAVVQQMKILKSSKDKRLSNLASIYLTDICHFIEEPGTVSEHE